MGDETGLRPKAGRQREEPPGVDWVRRKAELGRRDGRRLRWISMAHSPRQEAAYPHMGHSVSRTVLVFSAYGSEAVGTQSSSLIVLVCFLVAPQLQWNRQGALLRRNTDGHETTLLLYYGGSGVVRLAL